MRGETLGMYEISAAADTRALKSDMVALHELLVHKPAMICPRDRPDAPPAPGGRYRSPVACITRGVNA